MEYGLIWAWCWFGTLLGPEGTHVVLCVVLWLLLRAGRLTHSLVLVWVGVVVVVVFGVCGCVLSVA